MSVPPWTRHVTAAKAAATFQMPHPTCDRVCQESRRESMTPMMRGSGNAFLYKETDTLYRKKFIESWLV